MLVQYGPLIAAGAVLLSAALASVFAYVQIRTHKKIAQRRATLDLLVQKEWDADYIAAKHEFNLLRDAEAGLGPWAAPQHRNSPQQKNIRSTLNDYELIAIGISKDIIDEDVYKTWFRGSLLKDWTAAAPFVRQIRASENNPKIYIELETLAVRWGGNAA